MLKVIKSTARNVLPKAYSARISEFSNKIQVYRGQKAAKRCLAILNRSGFIESQKRLCAPVTEHQGHPKILWQCWFQGESSMPEIIKKNIIFNKPFFKDYKHIIVTFDNMNDYLELPEHILNKYNAGQITLTHLSDIVRVHLLSRHGGLWMDSTVLLTDNMPDYIANANFFCFQSSDVNLISSWFFVSAPNHPLINAIKELLSIYWKEYDKLENYFMLHYLFQAAVTRDAFYTELFDATPYDDNEYRADLLYFFVGKDFRENNKYDKVRVDEILSRSFIHKLTYKNNMEGIEAFYDQLEIQYHSTTNNNA